MQLADPVLGLQIGIRHRAALVVDTTPSIETCAATTF